MLVTVLTVSACVLTGSMQDVDEALITCMVASALILWMRVDM
jgi:hypothetical protein